MKKIVLLCSAIVGFVLFAAAQSVTPTDLTIPANVITLNNVAVDLGWGPNTTNFTLPAGSSVRTASSNNGPIGDPRWAF